MRDRMVFRTARQAAYALLVLAANGCTSSSPMEPDGPPTEIPKTDDPVGAEIANLGMPVTGCAGGASATMLTLQLAADEPAVINAPNGRLTVNGNACTSTVNSVTAPMITGTTTKILINGSSGDDKVII